MRREELEGEGVRKRRGRFREHSVGEIWKVMLINTTLLLILFS